MYGITAEPGHASPSSRQPGRTLARVSSLTLGLALIVSGCAFFPAGPLPQTSGTPPQAQVAGVPFFAQQSNQCGPAALAMVLNWSGLEVTPEELEPEVFSPGLSGSLQSALVGAARRHDRVAYPIGGSADLLQEVAAGHPIIVLLNLGLAWRPTWHYAVVTGYDQQRGEVYLHSGLIADQVMSTRVFANTWNRGGDWGLLVMPPARLPATAQPVSWLKAVSALEALSAWPAALRGYQAAIQRWDDLYAAWIGLGNSHYRLGRLEEAEQAFRRATSIDPDNGMAFNNLAQVLAEQGRKPEALKAAESAVGRGGPLHELYWQTYREIEQLPGN